MDRQEDGDGISGEFSVRDRIALSAMVLAPVAMAVGVAVTFAVQGPSEALSEMFSNGLMLWPM